MNARIVEFWEKCAGGAAAAAAFALPLAVHAESYDPSFIKELLLLAAAGFTAGFTALRALEAGRLEIPANRAWAAAVILVCAGAAAAVAPSTLASALILAPALLFIVVMTGPASISFMSSLVDSALAAGALASCWSLAQAAGYGAPLIAPTEFGVLLGAIFPLGLARGQHGAPAARLAARGAALLAALGVLVSGSTAGLLSLWIASGLFGLFGLAFARDPEARAVAFAALMILPATAWAAARSGMLDAWPVFSFTLTAPWMAAGVFTLWTLYVSGVDSARRFSDGEEKEAALITGGWAALAALAALSGAGFASASALGLASLLAGSLAGLAHEKGGAVVRVLPIPAGAAARRSLYIPALIAAVFALRFEAGLLSSEVSFNTAMALAQHGRWDAAGAAFLEVNPEHPRRGEAIYMAARALEEIGGEENWALAREGYLTAEATLGAPAVDLRLAKIHYKLGEWRLASERYSLASAKGQADAEAYRGWADVAMIIGEKETARRAALMLVSLAPEDPASWHFVSQTYRHLGETKTARRMLDKASRVQELAEGKKQSGFTEL